MDDREILDKLVANLNSQYDSIKDELLALEGRKESICTTLSLIRQWRRTNG